MPLKPPCEIVVSRIIPALRASLVKHLIDSYGLSQTEISRLLGITQPAVSQYVNQRRGGLEGLECIFPEIDDYTKKVAEGIASGELTAEELDLCAPCQKMRGGDEFCSFHRDHSGLQENCETCDEGRIDGSY